MSPIHICSECGTNAHKVPPMVAAISKRLFCKNCGNPLHARWSKSWVDKMEALDLKENQTLRITRLFNHYANDRITQQAFFDYLREEKRTFKEMRKDANMSKS